MSRRRVHVHIDGTVQGVGFRPFVYRVAHDYELAGWVCNTSQGVDVELEGAPKSVRAALQRLRTDYPPHATVTNVHVAERESTAEEGFEIVESESRGGTTSVLPDLATCDDCRREIFDQQDRRWRYPFTNCTNCGPRFSIIEAIPYDRTETTMRGFAMCERCRAEYEDPLDRRFHAQPNACSECGPRLSFRAADGERLSVDDEALRDAERSIREGRIVALKGLGGFHLVVDARSEAAVNRLRRRKRRPDRPFALIFPSLASLREQCAVGDVEAGLLRSARSPIVLLSRLGRPSGLDFVAPSVAPCNPRLGVMLPYTPLHLLLLDDLGFPVVATSANRSDEPICTDGDEAVRRLAGIADCFLDHDRPIARPVEDSVVQAAAGAPAVLRYARGFAPQTVAKVHTDRSLVAAGGHLKSAVAIARGGEVILGAHVGDLDSPEAVAAYEQSFDDLPRLHAVDPEVVVHDMHPDYHSTRVAERSGLESVAVQHHHAHVAAVMGEHDLNAEVLGFAWDGTGWGGDGTVWGGEVLRATRKDYERVGHLWPFRLPGGEAAIREPRRCALGVGFEALGRISKRCSAGFDAPELNVLGQMLERDVRCATTTSAGRLFDAVASLLGLRHVSSFEAQAAMDVQFAAERAGDAPTLPMPVREGVLDWRPTIRSLLDALDAGIEAERCALAFHHALARGIAELAAQHENERVVLGGGCFQNRLLLELTIARLNALGRSVYWPQRIPAGDGGLAVGQVVVGELTAEGAEKEY